jgi:hypothetical protein
MEYVVARSTGVPDESEYRVEAINFDGDGECYVALFWGPLAKERAEEYAEFKRSQQ